MGGWGGVGKGRGTCSHFTVYDTHAIYFEACLMPWGPETYLTPNLHLCLLAPYYNHQEYCSEHGVPPGDMWEGSSILMGNSVPTWRKHYNPSRRQRLAQRAVAAHAAYHARRVPTEAAEEEEEEAATVSEHE